MTFAPHTMPAALALAAATVPDREFVVGEDGTVTYAAAAARCAQIAAGLRAAGLGPGDRIGVLLPNGIRWCLATLGAHAAGLAVVPLNTWFRAGELSAIARRAGLRAVIADVDGVPDPDLLGGGGTTYAGTFCWPRDAALPTGLSYPPTAPRLEVDGPDAPTEASEAYLLFTSGSSAAPKAVPLQQGNVIANAHAIGERQGVIAGDRFWLASPLFFVFGCANALPNALTHAATLCVQERFDAASALAFIQRNRCTVYYAVAPITRALAAAPELATHDISTLRTGTANATADDLRLAVEVLGVREVCNAYGMTEGHGHTTITSHLDPPEVRIRTQGTVLPTQQLRVVGPDGQPTAPGTAGEIEIRGAIMTGYLDDPARNADAFTADGWLRTHDLGTLDAAGRLSYLGRNSEMMKVKGINIAPAEVEGVLAGHDLVDEAYVFGLPTPEGDEQVACALVTSAPTAARADLAGAVTAWARGRMASYKVPTRIWVVTAVQLPLTPTGKVAKRLLRDRLAGLAGPETVQEQGRVGVRDLVR